MRRRRYHLAQAVADRLAHVRRRHVQQGRPSGSRELTGLPSRCGARSKERSPGWAFPEHFA